MKPAADVCARKLRGGFYTPPAVVDWCLDRVERLRPDAPPRRFLEPAAGDGAFVAGLARRFADRRGLEIVCIEPDPAEAARCEARRREAGLGGAVIDRGFFTWARAHRDAFDAVVGNPPFIRYQYLKGEERRAARELADELGMTLNGVSNIWIPLVAVALARLRPGGAFGLVLPWELLATVFGGQIRRLLVRDFEAVTVDLFPRATFPAQKQDVLVVSGVRAPAPAPARPVAFRDHADDRAWVYELDDGGAPWTRCLLPSREWEAFRAAAALPGVHRMGDLAQMQVAITTGANAYFTVDDATLERHALRDWARPLLARAGDAPGIVLRAADLEAARLAGKRAWLLDFSADRSDPEARPPAAAYLRRGEAEGLPRRFKCRVRHPWYRVPHIARGRLMMTKRAHRLHRLILNEAGGYTTDTLYRGDMRPAFADRAADLVAGFHGSLTALSMELEGRSYGGGVLELVPSELARLRVFLLRCADALPWLDRLGRQAGGQRDAADRLIGATDELLRARLPGYADLVDDLAAARHRLRDRRFTPLRGRPGADQ